MSKASGRGGPVSDPDAARSLGDAVRLQKLLARAGIASRRTSEEMIVAGRVKVNGRVVTELGSKVDPSRDRVSVDGKTIALEAPTYVVLNKPDAFVTSAEPKVDPRGRPTVISLLRGLHARVVPVGRLDYHTRGVLLLTNDGDLAARLLHPRHKVPKTYHAKFQGRLGDEAVERLKQGVVLDDGTLTEPLVELLVIKDTEANTWAQLTLAQGLNRQIRRMGEAVGHPVLKLLRVAFSEITTDGLPEGQWRNLREAELAELRVAAGLAKPTTTPAPKGGARSAPKGAPKGGARATPKGAPKGGARATPKGAAKGAPKGGVRGAPKGAAKGAPKGGVRGAPLGAPKGAPKRGAPKAVSKGPGRSR